MVAMTILTRWVSVEDLPRATQWIDWKACVNNILVMAPKKILEDFGKKFYSSEGDTENKLDGVGPVDNRPSTD